MRLLVIFLSLLTMTACEQQGSTEQIEQTGQTDKKQTVIIELNDQNIEEFSLIFAEHYQLMLDELLHGFKQAKEENDSHVFVSYRNFYWTPKYVEKKNYYQAVLEKNRSYVSNSPARPLFDHFEQLIYIGLDLKHGLNDGDQTLIHKTFVTIENDKQDIRAILKRITSGSAQS